uniref:Uncharacterized protein n=1 Tax=Anguilla anguilla TaxID=7936 RepID=A0A0E9U084_ANGAN
MNLLTSGVPKLGPGAPCCMPGFRSG